MNDPAPRTLVFVYGTLKRGCSNHGYLAGQQFVGEARTTPGFRLIDLGEYPGLVTTPSGQSVVSGEIWSVDSATLAQLDALEGIAEGLYRREPVTLEPPFSDRRIETYLYDREVTGRHEIPNGLWTEK